MNIGKNIKILISILALMFIIIKYTFPNIIIDSLTVTLILIAIIPWLFKYIKSTELPGGFKIEFKDIKKEEEKLGLNNSKDKKIIQSKKKMNL